MILIYYAIKMLPFVVVSLPLYIIFRIISIKFLMKKKNLMTNTYHETGLAVFFCIIAGLAYLTVVQSAQIVGFSKESVNLIPFNAIRELKQNLAYGNTHYLIVNIIGNVLAFIPIGIFVPLLWKNIKLGKVALIGCLSSMLIEILQLTQMRITDIDDVFLNTFGAVSGFLIYMLINKLFPNFSDKFKTQISIRP